MTLQEFVIKHGTAKLFAVAEAAGTKRSYINNLLYTINSGHNPPKTPSIKLAKKLCEASKGELTMEGLATPTGLKKNCELPADNKRPRMTKGFANNTNSTAVGCQ
jgi:hypothetical protein